MGLIILILELLGVGIAVFVAFLFLRKRQIKSYFKSKGIAFTDGSNERTMAFLKGKLSFFDSEQLLYNESQGTNQPLTGIVELFFSKAVVVTDLDLIKNIFIKDFDHFVNRRKFTVQKGDVLFKKMLLLTDNERWKGLRAKLSPAFTTGKIRRMFSIIDRSSNRMSNFIKKRSGPSGLDMNFSEIFSKFAMDVIASCAFGVDCKPFNFDLGDMSELERMGNRFQFKFTPLVFLKFVVMLTAPKLADVFGWTAADKVAQDYFLSLVKTVIKHRRETGERQEDFLQLMMDVEAGLLKADEKEVLEVMTGSTGEDAKKNKFSAESTSFDDDDIVANCVNFLRAGYDTVQSLCNFTVYALALHQEVQEKLRKEIIKAVEENGGKLTYDVVHDMKYLDLFINETLRYYTPSFRTERLCNKDYKVAGTNAVIEKGMTVIVPNSAIHRDPKHFKDPEKFDPERFLPERKGDRHPFAFLAFGHGPRNCIGTRFALTEVKTMVANLVYNFKLEPCEKTEIPVKLAPTTVLKAKNGIWLRVQPIHAGHTDM